MALASGSLFEIRASATTGNVNGAGFNTANSSFPTDLAATSATSNAPVVTSATYTFVAGDVGAWVYVRSGTNFTPGFYQIASVATGAATLNATIGAATQLNTATNMWAPSTVAGIATVASPTGGTFGVDYSQQDAAQATATDYASTGASTTLTSISAGFTRMMVGNFIHITTTGTGGHFATGWYEIVTYTNATTVTTDRTTNDGTAGVAGTGFVGGAGRLNGLEDALYEAIPSASTLFIKSGTYTTSSAINIASTTSTAALMTVSIGYTSVRGDSCTGANRPTITAGANIMTWGQAQSWMNVIMTSTATITTTTGANTYMINCKILNTSTTTTRVGVSSNNAVTYYGCELISQNGTAGSFTTSTGTKLIGCYIHDSINGIVTTSGILVMLFNIFEACGTAAVTSSLTAFTGVFLNNTFYGREAKIGIGLNLTGANTASVTASGNIFYGLVTAALNTTGPALSCLSEYNDYFNNTTDATNWYKMPSDIAVNPTFTSASQITGTTATTSGSVLTDGSVFAGVNDNVDFLHVLSGTGVTVGIYLITSHTGTTVTVNNALGTSSGGDVVYFITNGHNFAVGTNLRATAFPGVFPAALTTGYLDTGAVQRQESGGGTVAYTFS